MPDPNQDLKTHPLSSELYNKIHQPHTIIKTVNEMLEDIRSKGDLSQQTSISHAELATILLHVRSWYTTAQSHSNSLSKSWDLRLRLGADLAAANRGRCDLRKQNRHLRKFLFEARGIANQNQHGDDPVKAKQALDEICDLLQSFGNPKKAK